MKTQAVVIKISKSEEFGKVGEVVAEVASLYLADAMATGLQRMQYRGEFKGDADHIGFMYCGIDRINHAASSYGFALKQK
ncbi:hypothetical protein CL97_gp136 [Cronobacter phage CR9]|uniref:Uncharacterized protein n=1 Tax=Cronobacter phage CR9 TaxID=1162290 RepID=M1F3L4_9CAUD|nr:hypothetical protein CL97_gp136 [Cronobacter phage CR9]AFH21020.1 hypothetical protein CR9_136 [Cronobacter phage CR9]